MRRLRPLVLCLCAAAAGCASPLEMRREVIALDGQWRLGEMEEDSFERMVEAVQGLGDQRSGDEARLQAEPDLLRLVLKNPSSLVRAEALRSAWKLASDLPLEPFRADELEKAEFNRRTQRLEVLIAEADDAAAVALAQSAVEAASAGATVLGAAKPARQDSAETLELATWLAGFHAPVEAPEIAVSMSEVVLSQALFRTAEYGAQDKLGQAFRTGMESSLRHALVVVTLHAASDPYPVVREEALASARHLHPKNALALVAGVLARESDSAVVLAALESLATLAHELPPEDVQAAIEPLAASTDVAVKIRIRQLLEQHVG
jgi:hypothetical protein